MNWHCMRSPPIPGTHRQSRKGFNIYFPLLFINILAKESIFFSRTVTTYTFYYSKKKGLCVCGYYFIHNIYACICIWKGWGYKKPVFLEKKKNMPLSHIPWKGYIKYIHIIYTLWDYRGEKKMHAWHTRPPGVC